MKLFIGTDSTWSLRTLICIAIVGIEMEVELLNLTDAKDQYQLKQLSPTGLVPFLQSNQLMAYDSLSIVEYLNEIHPNVLYPEDHVQRAMSRSLCAEIHSGFLSIRQQMPFSVHRNVEPITLPSVQALSEINRIEKIFSDAKAEFFWGEQPTAVDAFYAVMAYRLESYGVYFTGNAGRYQKALVQWSIFKKSLAMLC